MLDYYYGKACVMMIKDKYLDYGNKKDKNIVSYDTVPYDRRHILELTEDAPRLFG